MPNNSAQNLKPPQEDPNKELEKISAGEFFDISKWVFSVFWSINPFLFSTNLGLNIVNGVKDLLQAYIFGIAIDTLVKTAQTPSPNISMLYPYVILLTGYSVISSLLNYVEMYFNTKFSEISDPILQEKFYLKLKELGIQTLEQPEVNNKISRASITINSLKRYIDNIINIIAYVFRVGSSLAIVATISPAIIPLFVVSVVPSLIMDKKFRRKSWKLRLDNTESGRKANWSAMKLGNVSDLKEILITGSFQFLSDKYMNFSMWMANEKIKLRKRWTIFEYLFRIVDQIVILVGTIGVFNKLLKHLISVGDVTFQLRALGSLQESISSLARRYNELNEFALQVKDAYELFRTKPAVQDGSITFPKLEAGPEIVFNKVEFKYPNSDRFIFKNLNLKIGSGEKIAIVGHNGAGKTTIVNLICRLYQISSGSISVSNQNINDLIIDTWYRNIGVLFQDFNTYPHLTAKENIYIGKTHEDLDEHKIEESIKNADASMFIKDFKLGLDQTLSERFKNGIRPSTGQWQKLAIARFFYRDAPLVIFDEPTASIDAISEYNIFNKIYQFFKNKTVIIISHRFSTVRNADRILVLDKGEIVEQGTHRELLALNGQYATAFNLQAEGYSKEETNKIF